MTQRQAPMTSFSLTVVDGGASGLPDASDISLHTPMRVGDRLLGDRQRL